MRVRFESLPISSRYNRLALCETRSGIRPLSCSLAGSESEQNLDSLIWSKTETVKESERCVRPSNKGLYRSYMLQRNPVG